MCPLISWGPLGHQPANFPAPLSLLSTPPLLLQLFLVYTLWVKILITLLKIVSTLWPIFLLIICFEKLKIWNIPSVWLLGSYYPECLLLEKNHAAQKLDVNIRLFLYLLLTSYPEFPVRIFVQFFIVAVLNLLFSSNLWLYHPHQPSSVPISYRNNSSNGNSSTS